MSSLTNKPGAENTASSQLLVSATPAAAPIGGPASILIRTPVPPTPIPLAMPKKRERSDSFKGNPQTPVQRPIVRLGVPPTLKRSRRDSEHENSSGVGAGVEVDSEALSDSLGGFTLPSGGVGLSLGFALDAYNRGVQADEAAR